MLAAAKGEIREIKIGALEKLLKNNRDMALIDVRTRREITTVGGTIGVHQNQNIPRGWLEFRIQNAVIAKDTPIVVYCGTNQRSPLAARTLMKMGYTNVSNYAGGFFEWRKAGLPVEVADKAPDTALFSKPVKVAPNVWSASGRRRQAPMKTAAIIIICHLSSRATGSWSLMRGTIINSPAPCTTRSKKSPNRR